MRGPPTPLATRLAEREAEMRAAFAEDDRAFEALQGDLAEVPAAPGGLATTSAIWASTAR